MLEFLGQCEVASSFMSIYFKYECLLCLTV